MKRGTFIAKYATGDSMGGKVRARQPGIVVVDGASGSRKNFARHLITELNVLQQEAETVAGSNGH
jgi:hypothetical protein